MARAREVVWSIAAGTTRGNCRRVVALAAKTTGRRASASTATESIEIAVSDTRERSSSKREERTKDKGQRTKDKGQRSKVKGQGDKGTRGQGDKGTRGHGDKGTRGQARRHGDVECVSEGWDTFELDEGAVAAALSSWAGSLMTASAVARESFTTLFSVSGEGDQKARRTDEEYEVESEGQQRFRGAVGRRE